MGKEVVAFMLSVPFRWRVSLLIISLVCVFGCKPPEQPNAPQTIPVGPDALLYKIHTTTTQRAVETNGMRLEQGTFKDEDCKEILRLLERVPRITLKVERIAFFGSPHPVAAEVQLPGYSIYFVKPLYEEWKGGAVVIRN